jgi:prefoldin beta subunit
MDINKETEEQIKELQMLEQNLQNILMQKQAFQLELSEVENAIEELSKATGEAYKIVGNIMLKSSKEDLLTDLKQKQEIISLRTKSISAQETSLEKNADELRQKVLSKIKKN